MPSLRSYFKILINVLLAMLLGSELLLASDHTQGFDLTWQPVPLASSYQVEISADPLMSALIYSQKTKDTHLVWTPTEVGTYYWHVRAINGIGDLQTPSDVGTLHARVNAPQVIDKDIKVDPDTTATLKWEEQINIKRYRVEYSKDEDFKKLKFYIIQNQTELELPASEDAYWRVMAINNKNEPGSEYSPVGKIKVIAEADPAKGFKKIDFTAGMQYWKLSSVDTETSGSGQFTSSRSASLEISSKFQLYSRTILNAHLRTVNLLIQSPPNKTLHSTSYTNFGLGFDINRRYSRTCNIYFSTDFEQSLFVRALTLNHLTFDQIGILKFGLGMNKEITTIMNWKISANAYARYLTKARIANYTVYGGYAWGGKIVLLNNFSHFVTGVELTFDQEMLNSTIARQVQTFMGLNIKFTWDSPKN